MVPLADTSVAVAPDLSDPFAEGGLAWFRDKTELDCPYPIPGRRAALWLAGWRESQAVYDAAGATVPEVDLGEAGA